MRKDGAEALRPSDVQWVESMYKTEDWFKIASNDAESQVPISALVTDCDVPELESGEVEKQSTEGTTTTTTPAEVAMFITDVGETWLHHCVGQACTRVSGAGYGCGDTQFMRPFGISLNAKGDAMYIADAYNYRIQRCPTQTGVPCETVVGTCGDHSKWNLLADVVVDSGETHLFMTDFYTSPGHVWRCSLTDAKYCREFSSGYWTDENSHPYALAMDESNGILFVSDIHKDKNNVMKCIISTEVCTEFITGLNYPAGLLLDKDSKDLYLSEKDNHRVLKCSVADGACSTVAGGSQGSGAKQLDGPIGLDIDDMDNLYIADFNNGRVQRCHVSGGDCNTVATGIKAVLGVALVKHSS